MFAGLSPRQEATLPLRGTLLQAFELAESSGLQLTQSCGGVTPPQIRRFRSCCQGRLFCWRFSSPVPWTLGLACRAENQLRVYRRFQCWPERPSTPLHENGKTFWHAPGILRILRACGYNRRHSVPGSVPGTSKWEIPVDVCVTNEPWG